jgi:hypothetical protein
MGIRQAALIFFVMQEAKSVKIILKATAFVIKLDNIIKRVIQHLKVFNGLSAIISFVTLMELLISDVKIAIRVKFKAWLIQKLKH